jgi:hypothetical protein
MLRKFRKKFRQVIRLLECRRLFLPKQKSRDLSRKTVVLDFRSTDIFFRYHFSLAYAFKVAGWNVVWLFRPKYFLESWEFQSHLSWAERAKFNWRLRYSSKLMRRSTTTLVISDCLETNFQHNIRHLQLKRFDNHSRLNASDLFLPFWGYPEFLLDHPDLPPFEKKRDGRRYRVSFVGNCDPQKYDQPLSSACLLTRKAAKEILIKTFSERVMKIDVWEDKKILETKKCADILISDAHHAFLYLNEYVDVLYSSDFFLVLPGIASALTHSLYESIYCGCIPILMRSKEHEEKWQDGENCLLYHDEKSLVECIKLSLGMPEEQVLSIRENVYRTLYQNYSMQGFVERIVESESTVIWCNNV